MDNEAMPKVVKVGFTFDDPVNRALELKSTGNPYAYIVQYHALVDNPRGLERAVHEKLRQYRGEGEWFGVSLLQAIAAIREVGVRLLFEDESPRWHPSQPTPSETSRTKLQREKERLDRERREREATAQAARDREQERERESQRAERDRLDQDRRDREARQQRWDREWAEHERHERERRERARAARMKGDDFLCAVSITRRQATFGCFSEVLSARGEMLKFRCSPGIPNGERLRFRNHGHVSQDGGPPGDMFVIVRVQER
jgi:Skp family chaperone for outer membrane proteins